MVTISQFYDEIAMSILNKASKGGFTRQSYISKLVGELAFNV